MKKLPLEKTIKKLIMKDCLPNSVVYSEKQKDLDKLLGVIRFFWIPVEIIIVLAIIALLTSIKF